MVFIFTSGNQFRIVEMSSWLHSQIKPRVDANPLSSHTPLSHMVLIDNFRRISNSPPTTPPPILSPPPSSPGGRISPAVLFIIVILAVIFFISGLLHLLVRFFTKHRSSSPSTGQSSRYYPDLSTPDTYQRQLQQLFNLHDSGLDQAFIDALPVFHYKEIVGLKEPFDCAVCLCEFSDKDKLRLLPLCSHAFHIGCIDTWLLSNSTCPLCRGALYSPGLAIENPVFDFDESREEENDGCGGGGGNGGNEVTAVFGQKSSSSETEVTGNQKRVFHVRLGKFRNTNDNNTAGVGEGGGDIEVAETSSRLDARRCFSMGSYQYVVAESELQVALCPKQKATNGGSGVELKGVKGKVGLWQNRNFTVDEDSEGKRIGNKNESFSVSKIWLWSNKRKFPSSSSANVHLGSDDNSNTLSTDATTTLPWMKTTGGRP